MTPANSATMASVSIADRNAQRPIEPRSHHGSQEIDCGRALATNGSPDRESEIEVDAELLLHPAANQLDHLEDIASGGAGLDDHIVRVAVVDLGRADASADQSRL